MTTVNGLVGKKDVQVVKEAKYMATYIIGDIHGCFDEWISLKERIELMDKDAKFIFVGDIIDRGPKTMEMIKWAMENITPEGKYQMILGNHEYEKINWWNAYIVERDGLMNEIRKRHRENNNRIMDYRDYEPDDYDFSSVMSSNGLGDAEVEEIINFFRQLPVYKELWVDCSAKKNGKQHFIIVHASYPKECMNKDETFSKSSIKIPKKATIKQTRIVNMNIDNIVWERYYFSRSELKRTKVVHGHTPTISRDLIVRQFWVKPGQVAINENDINIDCGCVFSDYMNSNLCAFRLEDMSPFYLHDLEEMRV